jgi:hypothetical protein
VSWCNLALCRPGDAAALGSAVGGLPVRTRQLAQSWRAARSLAVPGSGLWARLGPVDAWTNSGRLTACPSEGSGERMTALWMVFEPALASAQPNHANRSEKIIENA